MPDGLLLQHEFETGRDVLDEMEMSSTEIVTLRYLTKVALCLLFDTEFDKNIEQINKVDLLYHEAGRLLKATSQKLRKRNTAQQRQRLLNSPRLAAFAGHFSARYRDLVPILEEARTIFPNSRLALEGEEFTIPD
jgi:ribonuclease Z